jgi:GAF domain-containing protein
VNQFSALVRVVVAAGHDVAMDQSAGLSAVRSHHEALGADAFARLAVELHHAGTMDETIQTVVQFALQAEACAYAGVTLLVHGRWQIAAVTDPVVTEIFQVQSDLDEGPILTALSEGVVVRLADTRAETRWPGLAALFAHYPIGSALHVPMWASEQLIGVLSLFNTEPNAFSVDDEAIAHILARHASIAVASTRNSETMAAAVDARKLVGQAMGILMERFDLDDTGAFEILKRYSQQNNTKLRDVAQELVDTRNLRGVGR